MKLLLDHNLSYKLIETILSIYPESKHVRLLNLHKESDENIRIYARENGFTIVTQDSDFFELATLFGTPPKIIWIRTGNVSTTFIEQLLKDNLHLILEFYKDDSNICLELI